MEESQPQMNPAEVSAQTPNDFERIALEAATAADAARAERHEAQGQAVRAETEHIEATLEERKHAREDQIFADAYAQSIRGFKGTDQEVETREQQATEAGRNAVKADNLWQQTYAAKLRELGATQVADPNDSQDMFNALARDAADEAVAKFNFANQSRVDKMTDLSRFSQGAQDGRTEVEQNTAPDSEIDNEARAEAARKEMKEREAQLAAGRNEKPSEPTEEGLEPVTAPVGGLEAEGSEGPQFTKESFPEGIKLGIEEVAKLKKELESKVGFGKRGKSKELRAAEAGLKAKIDRYIVSDEFDATGLDPLELKMFVNEAIAAERITIADTEIKGMAAKIGQGIDQLMKKLGKHKKLIIGLTAAGAIVLTGGIVLGAVAGAGAAMAAGAVSKGLLGAAIGGALGTGKAYAGQSLKVAQSNLQGAVGTRYAEAAYRGGDWHDSSRNYRDAMGRMVLGRTIVGGAKGVAVGTLVGGAAGASIAGYGGFFGGAGTETGAVGGGEGKAGASIDQMTPAEINEAQKEATKALIEGGQGDKVPGLENFNPDGNTQEIAAQFEGKGNNLWSKLQNVNEWSDTETWKGTVGNGSTGGGLEQLQANGITIDMGGNAEMVDGNIKFSGDTWWVQKAVVDPNVYPDGVYFVDPNNPMNVMRFDAGHQFTTNELAAVLDKTSEGWVTMQPEQIADQLAEQIAAEMPDTAESLKTFQSQAVDAIVKDVTAEVNQFSVGTSTDPNALAAVAAQKQAALQTYVNEHAQALRDFPSTAKQEFVADLAQQTAIPPEVIQKMLDDLTQTARAGGRAFA